MIAPDDQIRVAAPFHVGEAHAGIRQDARRQTRSAAAGPTSAAAILPERPALRRAGNARQRGTA